MAEKTCCVFACVFYRGGIKTTVLFVCICHAEQIIIDGKVTQQGFKQRGLFKNCNQVVVVVKSCKKESIERNVLYSILYSPMIFGMDGVTSSPSTPPGGVLPHGE